MDKQFKQILDKVEELGILDSNDYLLDVKKEIKSTDKHWGTILRLSVGAAVQVSSLSVSDVLKEALELHIEKNKHFKSQFLEDGEIGVVVRLKDKLNDIKNGGKPSNTMKNKKYEDWLDVINYATQGAYMSLNN